MWPKKTPSNLELENQRLTQLVDTQARVIHTLETALARATNQPLPAPWRPLSRPLSPNSPSPKIRGAESVSVMDREARREEDLKGAVQESFKLPAYMEKNTREAVIPPEQIPSGKSVGGGFSSPSAPPPDRSPTPEPPSTGS